MRVLRLYERMQRESDLDFITFVYSLMNANEQQFTKLSNPSVLYLGMQMISFARVFPQRTSRQFLIISIIPLNVQHNVPPKYKNAKWDFIVLHIDENANSLREIRIFRIWYRMPRVQPAIGDWQILKIAVFNASCIRSYTHTHSSLFAFYSFLLWR